VEKSTSSQLLIRYMLPADHRKMSANLIVYRVDISRTLHLLQVKV